MKVFFTLALIFMGGIVLAQTQYIAHRGASSVAPENTVASAKLGWELGADAVEVDVHLAKDNRVMVIHDDDTRRTCLGKNLVIKTSPSLLLRDLDAGSFKGAEFKGERIPYIREILEMIPEGRQLVIELKSGSDVIPYLKTDIEKSGKLSQLVFISFNWDAIVEVKKVFPENKCYWLGELKIGLKKKLEQVAQAGLDGIDLKSSLFDSEIVGQAKSLNLDMIAWTVDDPVEARRLISLGVVKLTTNRPEWLKQQVGQ